VSDAAAAAAAVADTSWGCGYQQFALNLLLACFSALLPSLLCSVSRALTEFEVLTPADHALLLLLLQRRLMCWIGW
jgi:hypothetical protein